MKLNIAAVLTLGLTVVSLSFQTTTNEWTSAGPGRIGACSAVMSNGRVLITGGENSQGVLSRVDIMGPEGSFTFAAPMLAAHSDHACVALDGGRVLVAGGKLSGGGSTSVAEVYDPKKNEWSLVGPMTMPRSGATATLLNSSRVLIAGGSNAGTDLASVEIFNPYDNVFEYSAATLSSARRNHAAAVLPNGRVVLAGGVSGLTPLDSIDIFDPVKGTVTAAARLGVARSGLSATTLLDGTVLLAGGLSKAGDVTLAELYNPTSNTVSVAASMAVARHGHQAVRLENNNTILIAGGTSAGAPSAAVEQYVPWQRTFKRLGNLGSSRTPVSANGMRAQATASAGTLYGALSYATVQTDRQDYPPFWPVIVTGSGWMPGETVKLVFDDVTGTDADITYSATADASGNILNQQFAPNGDDISHNFTLTATGMTSGLFAQTSFSDSSANLDQCANGSDGSLACAGSAWVNGNLGASKAMYFEGDSVPYRMIMSGISAGAHTVTIEWDTTKAGKHALDYLTGWDRNVKPGSAPCPTCAAPTTTFPIPDDPNASPTQIPGVFTLYGGTITGVSAYTLTGSYAGDSQTSISVTFTTTNATTVLAWGGHIATRLDWGAANSAVAISGSPYHTRLIGLDGTGGNQDRALSAEAVIFPASVTVVKQASPEGPTSFPFTSTLPALGSFSLVDDGTPSNTKSAPKITTFGSYTVTEAVTAGWDLDSIACSLVAGDPSSPGSTSTNGGTVTINLHEGDNVTCTFNNRRQVGSIKIEKKTEGGDDTFSFTSNFGVSSIATTSGSGSQTVTNLEVGGSFNISEDAKDGWIAGAFSCDHGTASAIQVVSGQVTTCTITNTKKGSIKIEKKTEGGDDTFNFSSNFGVSSIATNGGSGSQTVDNLAPGSSYSISEQDKAGWDKGSFTCDHGNAGAIQVLAGQITTCKITNTKRGSIKIEKKTEGGDDTFSFTSNFNVTSITTTGGYGSQTINAAPGSSYSISEQDKTGWDKGTFSCDHGNAGAIQVLAGQLTTCTITNTKHGSITIEKKTVGGDGTFTFTGNMGVTSLTTLNNIASQTVNNLTSAPSTPYTIKEDTQPGWDNGTFSCDHGSPTNITVLPGQTTKCTITNTMQSSIKIVKNTVGGDGTFSFNSNFGVTPITTTGGTGSQVIGNLNAGANYSISEIDQTGWEKGAFQCDNGTVSADAIQVLAGKLTTCTITNTKRGSVRITKTTVGGDGTFAYTGTLGLTSLSTSNGTTSQSFNNLKAGTYTVVENDPTPAFDFTSLVCIDPTGNSTITFESRSASIVLDPGETVICTYVNTKRGAIKIVKNTLGGDETFTFISNFGVTSIQTSGGSGSRTVIVKPGSDYSISEDAKQDWVQGSFTCDNGSPVTAIQVLAGTTTTCTVVNSKPAKLTLTKILNPSDGNTDKFDLRIDGVTRAFAVGNNGTTGPVVVTTGLQHKAGEAAAVGSSLSNYTWTYSGDCAPDGTITLQYGDNKVCYVTNNKKGKAQVIKTVNSGGAQTPATFDFVIRKGANSSTSAGTVLESGSVNGANGGTINFNTLLVPGDHYQMCEVITMPGWFSTLGPNAFALYNPGGNNVGEICTDFTVSPGQLRTFSVNNYIPSSQGLGSTIGFWKNWASCKKSNGGQKPWLDFTLGLSELLNPPPYGPGVTIGILTLHGNYALPQIAPDCAKAVALLNKSTIDTNKKMASDPAFNTAAQLLGAILNVDAGAAMCQNHRTELNYADSMLAAHKFNGITYTPFTAAEASLMNYLGQELDTYNNNGQCPLSLPVMPPIAPVITSANQVTFTNGVPATFQVKAVGGFPLTFSESGALPSGVTFDPLNAVLSYDGAAQAVLPTSNAITFTATNNTGGTVSQSFTVKIQ